MEWFEELIIWIFVCCLVGWIYDKVSAFTKQLISDWKEDRRVVPPTEECEEHNDDMLKKYFEKGGK